MVLVVGVNEREDHGGTPFDTVLTFGPDGALLGRHRKLIPEHLAMGTCDGFVGEIGQAAAESPEVSAEPPLQCYVFAACTAATGRSPAQHPRKASRRHVSRRGVRRAEAPAFTG